MLTVLTNRLHADFQRDFEEIHAMNKSAYTNDIAKNGPISRHSMENWLVLVTVAVIVSDNLKKHNNKNLKRKLW